MISMFEGGAAGACHREAQGLGFKHLGVLCRSLKTNKDICCRFFSGSGCHYSWPTYLAPAPSTLSRGRPLELSLSGNTASVATARLSHTERLSGNGPTPRVEQDSTGGPPSVIGEEDSIGSDCEVPPHPPVTVLPFSRAPASLPFDAPATLGTTLSRFHPIGVCRRQAVRTDGPFCSAS